MAAVTGESYSASSTSTIVPKTMSLDAVEHALSECNRTVFRKPFPNDSKLYCNRTFDGLLCWDDTPAGTRTTQLCPEYGEGFDPTATAFKDCTVNGTWWEHPESNRPWTNYTGCVNNESLEGHKQVVYLYIGGYFISITFLAVALGIFFYFRQLKCDRVLIHQHLFVSYILSAIVWILSYKLIYLDAVIITENPMWCRVLHVTTRFFTLCNYFWMFCEGLYLHTIIVTPFSPGAKLMWICYAVGWGVPVIPTVAYSVARGLNNRYSTRCWMKFGPLEYIIVVPIIVTLFVNLVFLLNILRILLTKLRASYARETCQTRKAVRATLILIPLLGIQYLLMLVRPAEGTPGYLVYKSVVAFLSSFQGFFVALLFCFLNGEVRNLLERKWRKRLKQQESSKRSRTSRDAGVLGLEMSARKASANSPPQAYTQDDCPEEENDELLSPTLGNEGNDCTNGDIRR
ncbi:calcitonin gene-related peptide type 1 receptor-like isoform X2 [Liolophura sinensis]|uniref:calcitonin gene-related peptide type 1 receptor-like isoform X2 n=1 Tax=Liolophura sinensis TaxID=3198878 RepID=UPI003157FFC2